jgi:hypothetical protein
VGFKLFCWPVEENIKYMSKILFAPMKTLTNYETLIVSRIKILLRITISVNGKFSPRNHLLLDRGKVGLNTHVMGGLRNIFLNHSRVPEQVS